MGTSIAMSYLEERGRAIYDYFKGNSPSQPVEMSVTYQDAQNVSEDPRAARGSDTVSHSSDEKAETGEMLQSNVVSDQSSPKSSFGNQVRKAAQVTGEWVRDAADKAIDHYAPSFTYTSVPEIRVSGNSNPSSDKSFQGGHVPSAEESKDRKKLASTAETRRQLAQMQQMAHTLKPSSAPSGSPASTLQIAAYPEPCDLKQGVRADADFGSQVGFDDIPRREIPLLSAQEIERRKMAESTFLDRLFTCRICGSDSVNEALKDLDLRQASNRSNSSNKSSRIS
jgi:hypothetical protein